MSMACPRFPSSTEHTVVNEKYEGLKVGTETKGHGEVFTGRWPRELRVIHTS